MTNIERYSAIRRRDSACDHQFVYGVVTTGIFCRPSCKSRQPKLENIRFFSDSQSAGQAGFRACKRCKPASTPDRAKQIDPIRHAAELIATHVRQTGEGPPKLGSLAEAVGMSPWHLQRRFKSLLGLSPREYADALRLGRLKSELRHGNGVADAVYGAGFGSASRVYERANTQLGMTPASYAKGGRGATIRFAVQRCTLGYLLVASTVKGLCMVSLGESKEKLATGLRTEFPAADIYEDKSALNEALKTCLQQLAGQKPDFMLALDVRATAFQWRVWRALREIPCGETRTYKEIAIQIGTPNAVRAVGSACAHNPVALTIPCHRVLRTDGGLGGYRWGIDRKKRILKSEQAR